MIKLNPEQTARAIVLCIKANLPVAVWSKPGTGKSSIIAQIASRLKWSLYDVRLGDKETSDFAIPMPDGDRIKYLMTDLLPFEGQGDDDEKCIVLLDEYDRARMQVQNMSLQITLDRRVFGKNLKKNARIVLAGNQATDIGTNMLSEASATRMVHIYMETDSEAALEAWDAWADGAGISPEMRAFAHYRKDVWNGPAGNEMIELGKVTKRTWENADRLYQISSTVKFKTDDILRAVIAGCVGTEGMNEFMGWVKIWKNAPTEEEILQGPMSCRLPDKVDITFALSLFLARRAKETPNKAAAFMRYASRWAKEQQGFFFRHLAKACPECVTFPEFQKWENGRES